MRARAAAGLGQPLQRPFATMVQLTTPRAHLAVQQHQHDEAPGCSRGRRVEEPKNVSTGSEHAKDDASTRERSVPLDAASIQGGSAGRAPAAVAKSGPCTGGDTEWSCATSTFALDRGAWGELAAKPRQSDGAARGREEAVLRWLLWGC